MYSVEDGRTHWDLCTKPRVLIKLYWRQDDTPCPAGVDQLRWNKTSKKDVNHNMSILELRQNIEIIEIGEWMSSVEKNHEKTRFVEWKVLLEPDVLQDDQPREPAAWWAGARECDQHRVWAVFVCLADLQNEPNSSVRQQASTTKYVRNKRPETIVASTRNQQQLIYCMFLCWFLVPGDAHSNFFRAKFERSKRPKLLCFLVDCPRKELEPEIL